MNQFNSAALKSDGFVGFVSVETLRAAACAQIPELIGVYVVIRPSIKRPKFLAEGPPLKRKGKELPSFTNEQLSARWIDAIDVIYIGMAGEEGVNDSTLRSRIRQFVAEPPASHRGGRAIWQIEDSKDLLFAWKIVSAPAAVETKMLADFRVLYGRLPFANEKH